MAVKRLWCAGAVSLQQRQHPPVSARENSPVCPLHYIASSSFSPIIYTCIFSFLYENIAAVLLFSLLGVCFYRLGRHQLFIDFVTLLDGPPPFYSLLRNSLKLRSSSLNMYFCFVFHLAARHAHFSEEKQFRLATHNCVKSYRLPNFSFHPIS